MKLVFSLGEKKKKKQKEKENKYRKWSFQLVLFSPAFPKAFIFLYIISIGGPTTTASNCLVCYKRWFIAGKSAFVICPCRIVV